MRIKIKRFDKTLDLPSYKTNGAAAFDLSARETIVIKPNETQLIPLNVALEVPSGYFTLLCARSSAFKLGIMPLNGIGIIDSDYCGNDDEIKFLAYNFTNKEVVIEKGTRIAQALILKYEKAEIEEVDEMKNKSRGGFGSTGVK